MIQQQPGENINSSQMQANQFVSQVHDPGLFTTMQEVIKKNKEKIHVDEKKEEGIEEEGEEKQGEEKDKDLAPKYGGLSKSMIQRRIQNKKLIDEFKNIFNKENSNINDCRRCLIHLIIVVGVINCCAWEIDCLFLNVCYGENIEMKQWISITLFPVIVISIILLYVLFDSINYLRRKIIMTCIIIYIILSLFLLVLGAISISLGCKYSEDDAEEVLKGLTKLENKYYEENDLKSEYRLKMVISGVLDLFLGLCGLIVCFLTVCFTALLSKTSFDWRPPLRSHIRPTRVKKATQLYYQNYDSYFNVFRAENPNYQVDEIEAKEGKNRFAGVRSSMLGVSQGKGLGGSIIKEKEKEKKESENDDDSFMKKIKKKKKVEKSENSNEDDELPIPTIKKKKRVLLNRIIDDNDDKKDKKKDEDNKGENNNINNHVDNHVNNHVNNHIQEEEINTDIKENNNKEEI